MCELYNAGKLGKIVYTEGEYYSYYATGDDSKKGWHRGLLLIDSNIK